MEPNTINECWKKLESLESYTEIQAAVDAMPSWSGDWFVEEHCDEGYVHVENDCYDDDLEDWNHTEEDLMVLYY